MKKPAASAGSPSDLITGRINELGDWRGRTLARVRALIHEAELDASAFKALVREAVALNDAPRPKATKKATPSTRAITRKSAPKRPKS